jgi:hypothetical protein
MPYPQFDRNSLKIKPLSERIHDMKLEDVLALDHAAEGFEYPSLPIIVSRIRKARQAGAPVILMMGAHVIKRGCSRFVIDLMEKGWITHVGMNGAGCIHDYELALIGATTESVAHYIQEGQFGLWRETGNINTIASNAVKEGIGLGEAVGNAIYCSDFPHSDISILAAGVRLNIPVTIHVSIGQDIIHELPECDGASLGESSYRDFLVFAHTLSRLENGVYLNVGTAVMGPEVYLKALSMVRNAAFQKGEQIAHFTTAVFDLLDLGEDLHHEPSKSEARYYYRPFKTILVRTVADGGESYYVQGDHTHTLPALHHMLMDKAT